MLGIGPWQSFLVLAFTAALVTCCPSFADECTESPIVGWHPEFNRSHCIEVRVSVPRVPQNSVHVDHPGCAGGTFGAQNVFDEQRTSAEVGLGVTGAAIGSTIGPEGTIGGAAIGVAVADALHRFLQQKSSGFSNCAAACVVLPANAINIVDVGWAREGNGPYTACGPNAECGGVGYAAMNPMTYKTALGGAIIHCTDIANWDDSADRDFAYRVEYDLQPGYYWQAVDKGDCPDHDSGGPSPGAAPEIGRCTAGLTAVCWDNDVFKKGATVGCAYKDVSPSICKAEGTSTPGMLYQCILGTK
jgi:hypothetical protein